MVDSSLRMEMKALIVRTSDSNLEHLLMVLYSRSKVQHLSLYYQYTLVVEPLTLVVKVLINIPKFTLAKVLYSDLFLLQNLLLLRVLLLDYFPSMVQQKKRIQRFTLEQGSLFTFVSKTESTVIQSKSQALFRFTGAITNEHVVFSHLGTGTFSTFSGTSYHERVAFDYNEDSIVNVEHENYGFVTSATADQKISDYANQPISNYANEVVFDFGIHPNSEDFGHISIDPEQSINTVGHNHEDYGVINTTNRFPYGGFQFEDQNDGTDTAGIPGSNSEHLQVELKFNFVVLLKSLSCQFMLVVESSILKVLLLISTPRTMSVKVLYSDLFLLQNLLLYQTKLLDSSPSVDLLPRRIPRIMLVMVTSLHLLVLQKPKQMYRLQTVCSRLLVQQQTSKLYSHTMVLVLSLELLVPQSLSPLTTIVIPRLLTLGQIIMDSSVNLFLTRQSRIMLMTRLAPMQMR